MTSPVPGFDGALHGFVERAAAASGTDVNAYVARAVAAALVADATRTDDPELASLLEHIDRAGLTQPGGPDTPTEGSATDDPVLNDSARLRALLDTGLLDAEPDKAYDQIVTLVAEALAVPTAAVSLVDNRRQFICNAIGLDDDLAAAREVPLDQSVCQYTVSKGRPLIVEDARLDPELSTHPSVVAGALVAYAGIPLVDPAGHAVGTLCVWDTTPRQWSTGHVQILQDLAVMVGDRMFGPPDERVAPRV